MKETPSNRASVHRGLGFQWMTRAALIGTLVVIGGSEMGCKASGIQQVKKTAKSHSDLKSQSSKISPISKSSSKPVVSRLRPISPQKIMRQIQQAQLQLKKARDLIRNNEIQNINNIRKQLVTGTQRLSESEVRQFSAEAFRYQLPEFSKLQNILAQKTLSNSDRQFLLKKVKLIFIQQKKILESHVLYLRGRLRVKVTLRSTQMIQAKILKEIQDFENIIKAIDSLINQ